MSTNTKPPRIDRMTDAELGAFVRKHHTWVNGMTLIRENPPDDILIGLGRIVVDALRSGELQTDEFGGMACALWFNAS